MTPPVDGPGLGCPMSAARVLETISILETYSSTADMTLATLLRPALSQLRHLYPRMVGIEEGAAAGMDKQDLLRANVLHTTDILSAVTSLPAGVHPDLDAFRAQARDAHLQALEAQLAFENQQAVEKDRPVVERILQNPKGATKAQAAAAHHRQHRRRTPRSRHHRALPSRA